MSFHNSEMLTNLIIREFKTRLAEKVQCIVKEESNKILDEVIKDLELRSYLSKDLQSWTDRLVLEVIKK